MKREHSMLYNKWTMNCRKQAFMALLALSCISATAQVTLHKNNMGVEDALQAVKAQANVVMMYESNTVDNAVKVDVDLNNASLRQALNAICPKAGLKYEIKDKYVLITRNNQRNMAHGRVIDSGGEAVIGAQVRWKDTKSATITNTDGFFTIPYDKVGKLVVSFVGYKSKEITVQPGHDITVRMEDDAQNLDELVVVGYGLQKKSSITGSVETIKAEDLLMMPTANLDHALSGQVAGLQVMESTGDPSTAKEAGMHIRGINSSPLLVIDGVPRFGTNTSDGETRLSDLNPDDIESITVLKDAAAAAVYGARAANGVILVQTKRADGKQKLKVNYRGQFNLQEATKLPSFLDAYEFAKLRNLAIANSPSTTLVPYTDEQLEQIRTHSNPNVYGNSDLLDYLDKTGYTTTHAVSATGGNEYVKYYLSLGYADSKGLYSGVGRNRLNYAMKIDATLAKGLVLSVDYTGSNSHAKNSSYTTIDAAYSYSPLQVLEFTNGDLASIDGSNPLINIRGLGGYMKDDAKMNTITANLGWDIPWVKGLSAYVRGTFDSNHRIEKDFDNPVTLYTYDANNDTYAVDKNTVYPTAKVTLEQTDRTYSSQLYEAGLNYNNTFAAKHTVGATLVMNYQRLNNQYMTGKNLDKSSVPETMGVAKDANLSGDESINERASLIGRLNYGYANKYFAEFSFRVDGSTNFSPDNRWGFFPSLSASWVISNEQFFRNWQQGVVSNLKLRASTGWLGNDGLVSSYSYLKNYTESANYGYSFGSSSTTTGNYRPGFTLLSYPNTDLSWGKTHDYNFGLDMGLWGGRIGLTFEYFIRYETDKITSAPDYLYPPSTGVDGAYPSMNFSKLKAWGWDFTISHRNTIGKLKYNMALNLAKSDDEYLDFGDETSQTPNLRRKGTSSMVWQMYEAAGLFQSQEEIDNWPLDQDGQGNSTIAPGDIKYVDQNGDHILDSNDYIYVKNSSYPDMDISFRLGVQYKGFFINAMFQGELGYKQNISDYYTLENGTLPKYQTYHLTDTWTEDNPTAKYPRVKVATANDNNRKRSTFWIEDCNFMRLKMLNIGYSFPTAMLKKMHLSSLSLALQGSNLFTISDLKSMDPESLRGYPVQRSYGVTLNLGF